MSHEQVFLSPFPSCYLRQLFCVDKHWAEDGGGGGENVFHFIPKENSQQEYVILTQANTIAG